MNLGLYLKIVLMFFLLTGCIFGKKGPRGDQLIYYATSLGEEPWSLYSAYTSKGVFYRNVFTQALYLDNKSNIVPGLFKDWTWDEASTSYIFTIDNKYSFGPTREVKPMDIEFALLKVFISTNGYRVSSFLKSMLGLEKLRSGMKFKSGMCDCIKILSPTKMAIKLKKNNDKFLIEMADFYFPIAPVEDFLPDMYAFKDTPRGSGPYEIISYDTESVMAKLRLKDDFIAWKVSAKAPRVVEFYNKGDPTTLKPHIASSSAKLDTSDAYRVERSNIPGGIQLIDFNFENVYGRDPDFRKAVSICLDRSDIVKDKPELVPHGHLVTNLELGVLGPERKTDKEGCNDIVNKKFPHLRNLEKPLKAYYYGSIDGVKPEVYSRIEKQLQDSGIPVVFEAYDFANLKRGQINEVVMTSFGKILPYGDYLYSFSIYSEVSSNSYMLNYDPGNTRMIELFNEVVKANSGIKKKKLANLLAKLHAKNNIQVPLFLNYPSYFVQKDLDDLSVANPEGLVEFGKIDF